MEMAGSNMPSQGQQFWLLRVYWAHVKVQLEAQLFFRNRVAIAYTVGLDGLGLVSYLVLPSVCKYHQNEVPETFLDLPEESIRKNVRPQESEMMPTSPGTTGYPLCPYYLPAQEEWPTSCLSPRTVKTSLSSVGSWVRREKRVDFLLSQQGVETKTCRCTHMVIKLLETMAPDEIRSPGHNWLPQSHSELWGWSGSWMVKKRWEKKCMEKAPGEGKVPFGLNLEESSSQFMAPNMGENGTIESVGPQNGKSRLSEVWEVGSLVSHVQENMDCGVWEQILSSGIWLGRAWLLQTQEPPFWLKGFSKTQGRRWDSLFDFLPPPGSSMACDDNWLLSRIPWVAGFLKP